MATRSVISQVAAQGKPERFEPGVGTPENLSTSDQSKRAGQPQKMVAVFLSPGCEHDWFKVASDLQTLEAEGKTIWQCRTCDEITNTYDWQTP